MQVVVTTHNEGRLVKIRRALGEDFDANAENAELVSTGSLYLPDPAEASITFRENTLLKVRAVTTHADLPAVADDSGLVVSMMGNAPDILSVRWAGVHNHDKANNALLFARIEDIPDDRRTARPHCAATLVTPDTKTGADVTGGVAADDITAHTTAVDGSPAPVHARYAIKSGTVKLGGMPGYITRRARGIHGFGYDPLFVPNNQPAGRINTEPDHEGEPLTSAEMTPAEKNAISHRGKVLETLVPAIKALLH